MAAAEASRGSPFLEAPPLPPFGARAIPPTLLVFWHQEALPDEE